MNKTEARFCTSSQGIGAYLLWHSIYPDRVAELSPLPTLLYFGEKDYDGVMLKYWKGVVIPACEFGECLATIQRVLKEGQVDTDWFFDMWDEIYDIRSDYKNRGQLELLDVV
jgi:hypothetical protein